MNAEHVSNVLFRKMELDIENHRKAQYTLEKREIKRKFMEHARISKEIKDQKEGYEMKWLDILYRVQGLVTLRQHYENDLVRRQGNLLWENQARRLQRAFTRSIALKYVVVKNLHAARTSNSLALAGSQLSIMVREKAGTMITHFLQSLKNFFKFRTHCHVTLEKVLLVQKKWKKQMEEYTRNLNVLRGIWDDHVKTMVDEIYASSKKGKPSRKQSKLLKYYFQLNRAESRDKSLKEYLARKIIAYVASLKEYHEKVPKKTDTYKLHKFTNILFGDSKEKQDEGVIHNQLLDKSHLEEKKTVGKTSNTAAGMTRSKAKTKVTMAINSMKSSGASLAPPAVSPGQGIKGKSPMTNAQSKFSGVLGKMKGSDMLAPLKAIPVIETKKPTETIIPDVSSLERPTFEFIPTQEVLNALVQKELKIIIAMDSRGHGKKERSNSRVKGDSSDSDGH